MSGSSTSQPSPSTPGGAVPAPVRVLTGLVLLQALALAAGAVALVVLLVRGSSMPGPVVFLVLLALGAAALLAGAARALLAGRRWGRAPVMTVQIMVAVLAVGWLGVEVAPWSVGVLVLAVVTGAMLLVPAVVSWTTAGTGR